jgi:hypothetical protein
MIAVLQDGCAVNRPHDFSDIFAWHSANIRHPDRKGVGPFFYSLQWEKNQNWTPSMLGWKMGKTGLIVEIAAGQAIPIRPITAAL